MQAIKDLFIGIDLGSSFIKISIVDQQQTCLCSVRVPSQQMKIVSVQQGWAEQDPELWWQYTREGLKTILNNPKIDNLAIKGIGISYQMHGLVCVNKNNQAICPANIWCDSRATEVGEQLYKKIKNTQTINKLLNHPSNFTISKLLWIKQHNQQLYQKIYKIMLPGDYLSMKLTGKIHTTKQGLTQGVFWDYQQQSICKQILQITGISHDLFPDISDNFKIQSYTTQEINKQFDFTCPVPIFYRCGDQPNNAFSLGVLQPGQVAATGGTSGVIFAATSQKNCKQVLKFNSFLHVNHTQQQPRIAKLLCISGCGSAYSWLRKNMFQHLTYEQMNDKALKYNSQQIVIIPFGNGAQRILQNKDVKCHIANINFSKHNSGNIIRAAVQGIAFSFAYGAFLMKQNSINIQTIKAGKSNLFQCQAFCQIISTLLGVTIQIYDTDGAQGAAKGALLGFLKLNDLQKSQSFKISPKKVKDYFPNLNKKEYFQSLYKKWKQKLAELLGKQQ